MPADGDRVYFTDEFMPSDFLRFLMIPENFHFTVLVICVYTTHN